MKKITKKQLSARQDELDKRLARIEFAKDVWLNEPKLKVFDQSVFDERDDIAKELLEIDLSSELTGSDLCMAMLARGDKYVMCLVGTHNDAVVIEGMHGNEFVAIGMRNLYRNPKPINNQGEPLTASEAGL